MHTSINDIASTTLFASVTVQFFLGSLIDLALLSLIKSNLPIFGMIVMALLGMAVYLYEPVSCMTDPPMQWGYPRTVEGFFHALSRGQYGSDVGTNIFQNPAQFLFQLFYL